MCLTRVLRQIVRQTPDYLLGQTYVLPLITAVLPGIDLNDYKKTLVTLDFLNTMFMMVSCVDCSSAVHTRDDLTEVSEVDPLIAVLKSMIDNLIRRLNEKYACQQATLPMSSVNF